MSFLTNEKVNCLMNHINSVKRKALDRKSSYELTNDDPDMRKLAELLHMMISADEVHLLPDLLDD